MCSAADSRRRRASRSMGGAPRVSISGAPPPALGAIGGRRRRPRQPRPDRPRCFVGEDVTAFRDGERPRRRRRRPRRRRRCREDAEAAEAAAAVHRPPSPADRVVAPGQRALRRDAEMTSPLERRGRCRRRRSSARSSARSRSASSPRGQVRPSTSCGAPRLPRTRRCQLRTNAASRSRVRLTQRARPRHDLRRRAPRLRAQVLAARPAGGGRRRASRHASRRRPPRRRAAVLASPPPTPRQLPCLLPCCVCAPVIPACRSTS